MSRLTGRTLGIFWPWRLFLQLIPPTISPKYSQDDVPTGGGVVAIPPLSLKPLEPSLL